MNIRDLALSSAFFVAIAGVAGAQEGGRYAFSDFDADADGGVTMVELETGLATAGVEDIAGSAASIMVMQDTNGDGVISPDEAGVDDVIYFDEG
jgi:Ca2+-binding EF-hand superfamily protein